MRPVPKVAAAGIGGAVATLVVYVAGYFDAELLGGEDDQNTDSAG